MRLRRRALAAIALVSALALASSGCAAEEGSSGDDEIPIGVDIELTGPASTLGGSYKNALDLIINDVNKKGVLGDKKIKLIIRDNKSDPAEAVRVAKNLWDNEKIVGMIGPGTSPTGVPVSVEAEKRKIPMFTMGSSGALINPVDKHRYIFKIPPNSDDQARLQVKEIADRKLTNVAYLAPADAFGDAAEKAFVPLARESKLNLVGIERFNAKATDFTVPVTKLLAKKPQALAIAAITPASSLIAKAIKQAGFTGPVVYEGGAGAELFIQGAQGASEGMYMVFPSILAANQVTATSPAALRQKEFFRNYSQRYGQFSGFAPFAADALNMFIEAMEKSNSTDPTKIRDAIEGNSFDGLTGRFQFTDKYHGGVDPSSLTVLTVRNGGWVLAN